MAVKNYWAAFGSGAPVTYSGLTPTFISFITTTGVAATAPSISEPGSKGLYFFQYDASATMIAFVLDGATASLATTDRYISGVLDPYDTFGATLNTIGSSLAAYYVGISGFGATLIGVGSALTSLGSSMASMASFIGTVGSTFGSSTVDPSTIFGFLKRAQEVAEGNDVYTKATGVMTISSRGSSTLLASKTIADSQTQTTKT